MPRDGRDTNLNRTFAGVGDAESVIVCESGAMSCIEQIPIRTDDYVRVQGDSALFLLVPGHDDPTVEVVTEERQAYVVVNKPPGSPAGVAADRSIPDRSVSD